MYSSTSLLAALLRDDEPLQIPEGAINMYPLENTGAFPGGKQPVICLDRYKLRKLTEGTHDSIAAIQLPYEIDEYYTYFHIERFKFLKCIRMASRTHILRLPTTPHFKHLTIAFGAGFHKINMETITECRNLSFLHLAIYVASEVYSPKTLEKFVSKAEEGVSTSMKSLFFTEFEPKHFTDSILKDAYLKHLFVRNAAIRYMRVKLSDLVQTNTFSTEAARVLSNCPYLEFLLLKGVKFIYQENLRSDFIFYKLQHLSLETCHMLRKREFDWMLMSMPVLHYLRMMHTPVQIDDFKNFLKYHESIEQVFFYTDIYIPYEFKFSDVVELLVKTKPDHVKRLCLCRYYDFPYPTMSRDKLAISVKIKEQLEGSLPCGKFPCTKKETCAPTCNVYCDMHLNCDEDTY